MAEASPAEIIQGLHEHEVRILRVFVEDGPDCLEDGIWEPDLYKKTGLEEAQARSAAERLKLKGVLEVQEERVTEVVQLGELGETYRDSGTPEWRVYLELQKESRLPAEVMEAARLTQEEWGVAFGWLKRHRLVELDPEGKLRWSGKKLEPGLQLVHWQGVLKRVGDLGEVPLDQLSAEEREEILARSRKSRGAGRAVFRRQERTVRRFRLTETQGRQVVSHWAGRRAEAGKPRERQYDFSVPPPRIVFGRAHPYRAFLGWVRSKLVALGFEEMTGDMVESEFWNSDALYMPQFHPARAIHDVYYVRGRSEPRQAEVPAGPYAGDGAIPEPLLERVADTHEQGGQTGSRGWRYRFDRNLTRRRLLRSQGTALSARWMAKGDLQIPGKYFAIARCFRNDTVDATHAPDFFQVEGIVVSKSIHLGHLLGLLKLFAEEIARAKEMKFLPAYFPYTEPSVEVHIRHPTLGWMEMGGSGIFRPEVTQPLLREEATVIAWGLGLDRMAMSALNVSDIRDLFSADLDFLRSRPACFL